MIIRYKAALGAGPEITGVLSNTLISSTANTGTWEIVISGPKDCIVGFQVTLFSSLGTGPENTINGTDYVLNDTFSLTLDHVTGQTTISQILSIANVTTNRINVQVTIETVSKGTINPSSKFWTNNVVVT